MLTQKSEGSLGVSLVWPGSSPYAPGHPTHELPGIYPGLFLVAGLNTRPSFLSGSWVFLTLESQHLTDLAVSRPLQGVFFVSHLSLVILLGFCARPADSSWSFQQRTI